MLGRLGLPFRGHNESWTPENNRIFDVTNWKIGLFNASAYLRIDAGDTALEQHLRQSPRNAIYSSNIAQNRIIDIIRRIIQARILAESVETTYYSVLVDSPVDQGGTDQLSIYVRYWRNDHIVEQLLDLVNCSGRTTGLARSCVILKFTSFCTFQTHSFYL